MTTTLNHIIAIVVCVLASGIQFIAWSITPAIDDDKLVGVCNEDGTKYGFQKVTGEIVIPPIYDQTGDFHDGLAAVCVNGYWGNLGFEQG